MILNRSAILYFVYVSLLIGLFFVAGEFLLNKYESKDHRQLWEFKKRWYQNIDIPKAHNWQYHDELGWKYKSGHYKHVYRGWSGTFYTDKDGFRYLKDGPFNPPDNKIKKRVMIIGDSHAFARGAHDNETIDYFILKSTKDVSLKNISAPGWSPEQYYKAFSMYGDKYKPTNLYVLLTYTNDLFVLDDVAAYNRFKPTVCGDIDGEMYMITPAESARLYKTPFIWNSKIISTLIGAIEPLYHRYICRNIKAIDENETRKSLYSWKKNKSNEFDIIWKKLGYIMSLFKHKAMDLGVEFKILLLPVGVDDKSNGEMIDFGDPDLSVRTVVKKIQKVADDNNVKIIYPVEEFIAAKKRG